MLEALFCLPGHAAQHGQAVVRVVCVGVLGDDLLQLQYTQTVLLNFKGLSWPHVTVATLHKD